MHTISKPRNFPIREALFTALWLLCVAGGFRCSCLPGKAFLDAFYGFAGCVPSLGGQVVAFVWPVVLLVFGILLYGPWGILPGCIIKGFSYGFCSGCAVHSFGSAGLLGWFFLMFSDTGLLWLLCWYSLRRVRLGRCRCFWDLLPVCLFAIFLCLADRLLIGPFWAELFS